MGKVFPVHKSGDVHSPTNYRPISLTSIPCKLLEHIIYTSLVNFLESNSYFTKHQHGFRKHHSCESQLLVFTNDLFSALDRSSITDCIFIDFAKAFDTVHHQLLLFKLSKLNLDSNVIKWIECFLLNRTQFVSVNDHDSEPCPVTSGVPQGSVLGPLLFLIYINDLPDTVNSSIRLFADDCVIYREIHNPSDTASLQTDLNNISTWCETWRMKLNVNKCKFMRVFRAINPTNPPTYYLNGSPLTAATTYKYLGVHITNNLSWETHVKNISNSANRTLGFLRRNFFLAPTALKLLLYKTLVRPKIEYASSVWDPGTKSLTSTLESLQNRSARFIVSNYERLASVTEMKKQLNLDDLSTRRTISSLCTFHKIYHSNQILKHSLFADPTYVSSRIDHNFKVGIPLSRTKQYHDSFVPKTSVHWNSLPASIVCITEPVTFKSAVYDYVHSL